MQYTQFRTIVISIRCIQEQWFTILSYDWRFFATKWFIFASSMHMDCNVAPDTSRRHVVKPSSTLVALICFWINKPRQNEIIWNITDMQNSWIMIELFVEHVIHRVLAMWKDGLANMMKATGCRPSHVSESGNTLWRELIHVTLYSQSSQHGSYRWPGANQAPGHL